MNGRNLEELHLPLPAGLLVLNIRKSPQGTPVLERIGTQIGFALRSAL
jgi:hypothetical protein